MSNYGEVSMTSQHIFLAVVVVVAMLIVAVAVAAVFARGDSNYFKYAKLEKNTPRRGRLEDGREAVGSRTAVETFPIRAKVGKKKPFANRIRELVVIDRC